jgi:hypothetical protein
MQEQLDGKQTYVSRLESRDDVKVSTLSACVNPLGCELQLLVALLDGGKVVTAGLRKVKRRRGSCSASHLQPP